jgi:hypothetical protein
VILEDQILPASSIESMTHRFGQLAAAWFASIATTIREPHLRTSSFALFSSVNMCTRNGGKVLR